MQPKNSCNITSVIHRWWRRVSRASWPFQDSGRRGGRIPGLPLTLVGTPRNRQLFSNILALFIRAVCFDSRHLLPVMVIHTEVISFTRLSTNSRPNTRAVNSVCIGSFNGLWQAWHKCGKADCYKNSSDVHVDCCILYGDLCTLDHWR